jgi:hypothetical protein
MLGRIEGFALSNVPVGQRERERRAEHPARLYLLSIPLKVGDRTISPPADTDAVGIPPAARPGGHINRSTIEAATAIVATPATIVATAATIVATATTALSLR